MFWYMLRVAVPVITVILLLSMLPALASVPRSSVHLLFRQYPITEEVLGAKDIDVADFDADGDMDLVAVAVYTSQLVWYEQGNQGPADFTPHILEDKAHATPGDTADIDGDSDIDLIYPVLNGYKVNWYINNGAGSPLFTSRTIITTPIEIDELQTVELNGDGVIDILAREHDQEGLIWYENSGGARPSFTRRTINDYPLEARAFHATDLDSDGDNDIVVLGTVNWNSQLLWFENDGSSVPAFTTHLIQDDFPPGLFESVLITVDFDYDNDADILLKSLDGTITWYKNDGDSPPTFVEHPIATGSSSGLSYGNGLAASDLDGDSDIDIVTDSWYGDPRNRIEWLANDGAVVPAFSTHLITTDIEHPDKLVVADMDGDGDIVVASDSGQYGVTTGIQWFETIRLTEHVYTPMTVR